MHHDWESEFDFLKYYPPIHLARAIHFLVVNRKVAPFLPSLAVEFHTKLERKEGWNESIGLMDILAKHRDEVFARQL